MKAAPTRPGSAVAVAAAALVVVLAGWSGGLGLTASLTGLLALGAGVVVGNRPAITLGGAGLLAGVLAAGASGWPIPLTLAGAVLAVLAWDSGTVAVGLGRQVGADAATAPVELARAGATTAIGVVTAGLGWALYRPAVTPRPVRVPVLLGVAALALVLAIRR